MEITNGGTSTRSRPQWKRGICLGVILRSDGCLIPVTKVHTQFIHITLPSVKVTGIFMAQEEVWHRLDKVPALHISRILYYNMIFLEIVPN